MVQRRQRVRIHPTPIRRRRVRPFLCDPRRRVPSRSVRTRTPQELTFSVEATSVSMGCPPLASSTSNFRGLRFSLLPARGVTALPFLRARSRYSVSEAGGVNCPDSEDDAGLCSLKGASGCVTLSAEVALLASSIRAACEVAPRCPPLETDRSRSWSTT